MADAVARAHRLQRGEEKSHVGNQSADSAVGQARVATEMGEGGRFELPRGPVLGALSRCLSLARQQASFPLALTLHPAAL